MEWCNWGKVAYGWLPLRKLWISRPISVWKMSFSFNRFDWQYSGITLTCDLSDANTDRISFLCMIFRWFRAVLALNPMYQRHIKGGYKLSKRKFTLAQKSDIVFLHKNLLGFMLICPLRWLCIGTKIIYPLQILWNTLYNWCNFILPILTEYEVIGFESHSINMKTVFLQFEYRQFCGFH